METVVLFADISGFTNISEACAKMGVRGNEELAFCINRYMEGMVKSLGKYGGDIIKFVGDAMIVMWPRSVPGGSAGGGAADKNLPTQGSQSVDDRTTVVRKAI
jgi:class 3 adenylate cyclase